MGQPGIRRVVLLEPKRVRGVASPENCNVIVRAQRRSKTSPRFFSTTRAVPVLYFAWEMQPLGAQRRRTNASQSKATRLLYGKRMNERSFVSFHLPSSMAP
jgi:hypothetical protein